VCEAKICANAPPVSTAANTVQLTWSYGTTDVAAAATTAAATTDQ
jgi:hypothetical protein